MHPRICQEAMINEGQLKSLPATCMVIVVVEATTTRLWETLLNFKNTKHAIELTYFVVDEEALCNRIIEFWASVQGVTLAWSFELFAREGLGRSTTRVSWKTYSALHVA